MTKNRDGKPTEHQLNKLRESGYKGKVKDYREAENALKRLARAANKAPAHTHKDSPAKAVRPVSAPHAAKAKVPAASAKKRNLVMRVPMRVVIEVGVPQIVERETAK